jgi:succinyl-CoA synthetase beta subunit
LARDLTRGSASRAEALGGQVVVKAQVLTAGRRKAGGIKLADSPEDAESRARNILGLDIRGHVVRRLWIELRRCDAERAARAKGVTYVKLDGEVGILGNGAGLVMSTLDVIAHVGGRPANFCDLGGGGDAQGVVDALEVITGDDQVESSLFNIFGGITRCDEVARGILEALGRMAIEDPIVVRLDGTNAEEGRRLLTEAAPSNLYVEETMLSAAERAVEVAR